MARRFIQIFYIIVLILSCVATPVSAQRQAAWIAIRIPRQPGADPALLSFSAERVFDYGSFLWVILDENSLSDALIKDPAGQVTRNPFDLTLGGRTFDPLADGPPEFDDGRPRAPLGEPGLHLVQFFGPTQQAWLDDLAQSGLEVIQYLHPFTYVVWGDLKAIHTSSRSPAVRWVGDFLPAYAIQSYDDQNAKSEPIPVRVVSMPQAGIASVISAVEKLGGIWQQTAQDSDPSFDLTTFILASDLLDDVAALPGVYSVQAVPLDGGSRGEVGAQVNANNVNNSHLAQPGYRDWLNNIGLSGAGVIVACVDAGIDQLHPDLANRMLSCSGSTCGGPYESDHGTHVAGIIAGDAVSGAVDTAGFLRGLGVAPAAHLIDQVYYPTYLNAGGMLTLMSQSFQNGAFISNNSWGPAITANGYDADTRLVDVGVRDADPGSTGNQPLSYILSIMNGYGGTSTQGTPDEAKNALTVGATYLQYGDGSQNPAFNDLSHVTAHGPALDGRIIPHIVAPGTWVDSTGSTTAYYLESGTSMAAPQVAGAAALFSERYRLTYGADPSPAMIKAAILPLAHDLAGHYDADGGLLGHPFDAKQGWGRLNVAAVVNPDLLPFLFDQQVVFDNTGEFWTFSITSPEPITTLRVMLAWTDAPGHGLGGSSSAWVNDLDLSVTVGANTYLGNIFGVDGLSISGGLPDNKNNTEAVFLENLPAGAYTFTVRAAAINGDGVPQWGDITDQDFALAIYASRNVLSESVRLPIFFH